MTQWRCVFHIFFFPTYDTYSIIVAHYATPSPPRNLQTI